ncbi:hypothetical protein Esti_000510 [Eimeria stiedai]
MGQRQHPPPQDHQQQQQQQLWLLVVVLVRGAPTGGPLELLVAAAVPAAPAATAAAVLAAAAAAAAVTPAAAAATTMPQQVPTIVAALLLLLIGSAGAAAAEAAWVPQEVAVLEQDVASATAGTAARPEAAAAEGSPLHTLIRAHFSLGDRRYEVPLSLGPSSGAPSRERGPKRGLVERAALSAAGAVLCLILFTIAKDLSAAAKAKYKKRQQRLAIRALTMQRLAALVAMRQAAEFLLELQPEVQQQQQQQLELLAAAAHLESKLLDLGDYMPETTRIGRLLISQLMKAAGVYTPEQQQQHVQRKGSDMEGDYAAAGSPLSGDTSGSTSPTYALYEEPDYLGPREKPQQLLPELEEGALGLGQSPEGPSAEELYQAMLAEGAPIGGALPATFKRMELLNALLSENVDLLNKDALVIISGVQGPPPNVLEAQGAPSL